MIDRRSLLATALAAASFPVSRAVHAAEPGVLRIGYPHLEEAYRFAELVFPKLPLRATTGTGPSNARNDGPFGEVIANDIVPARRLGAH